MPQWSRLACDKNLLRLCGVGLVLWGLRAIDHQLYFPCFVPEAHWRDGGSSYGQVQHNMKMRETTCKQNKILIGCRLSKIPTQARTGKNP